MSNESRKALSLGFLPSARCGLYVYYTNLFNYKFTSTERIYYTPMLTITQRILGFDVNKSEYKSKNKGKNKKEKNHTFVYITSTVSVAR